MKSEFSSTYVVLGPPEFKDYWPKVIASNQCFSHSSFLKLQTFLLTDNFAPFITMCMSRCVSMFYKFLIGKFE